jgi:hypothetical protein
MEECEELLTEKDVAKFLGVSESWLQKARCYKTYGPPWISLSGMRNRGAVRYRKADLEHYVAMNRTTPPHGSGS